MRLLGKPWLIFTRISRSRAVRVSLTRLLRSGAGADAGKTFAVRMTPSDPELREHVETVRVLLDAQRGLIIRLEMRDPDGDRTLISFSNVKS